MTRISRVLGAFLLMMMAACALAHAEPKPIKIYIAPPPQPQSGDTALARWAFDTWQHSTGDALRFVRAPEKEALVRLYWVGHGQPGGFGEMRSIEVNGHAGAALYVNTDMALLGPEIEKAAHDDALYRDTIVYLTCVHELGHGLGLQHTAEYPDIMYSFQYGGDIPAYFGRYRRRLSQRGDIAKTSPLSDGDLAQLHTLHAK